MILKEAVLRWTGKRADTGFAGRKIDDAFKAYRVFRALGMHERTTEALIVLMLSTRNDLIGWHEVAVGSLNCVGAMPREIYRAAIMAGAFRIIMAHNHPSGDPHPSPEDESFAAGVGQAGGLLGIELVDSLVIGDDTGFSIRAGEVLR